MEKKPPIRQLIHRITSETEDVSHVPKMVIFLNIVFRPVIGTVCAIRGHYDGRLSLVGLLLSIVYFFAFMVVIYLDTRFETMEQWARILPKLFGMVIAGIQVPTTFAMYSCTTNNWQSCI